MELTEYRQLKNLLLSPLKLILEEVEDLKEQHAYHETRMDKIEEKLFITDDKLEKLKEKCNFEEEEEWTTAKIFTN